YASVEAAASVIPAPRAMLGACRHAFLRTAAADVVADISRRDRRARALGDALRAAGPLHRVALTRRVRVGRDREADHGQAKSESRERRRAGRHAASPRKSFPAALTSAIRRREVRFFRQSRRAALI